MREQIHTIPVIDGLKNAEICPFCAMKAKLERDAIQFALGPSYMEDDVRMETNQTGFCPRHMEQMYAEQNRLGLGLMTHTHLQQLVKDCEILLQGKSRSSLFGRDTTGPLAQLRTHLEKVNASCYICNKVDNTFLRYIDTFLYLWAQKGEEAKLIAEIKGFCLPHFVDLLKAAEGMSKSKRDRFTEEIAMKQLKFMQELEGDVEWFTLKFDFRNKDEPWKNSKDALPRALNTLGAEGIKP